MENSLIIPKLKKGQVSVMTVETNTGHVLQTNRQLYTGTGEVFSIFESLSNAENYVQKELSDNSELEFVIYDWNGKCIMTENRFGKK